MPGNGSILLGLWMEGWANLLGIELSLVCDVTMVNLCAPQASNSFRITLSFRWGLVCHRVFLNICFFFSVRSSLWTCVPERVFIFLPFSKQKSGVTWCSISLVVGTGRGRLSPFFLGRLYVPRFLVGWGDFFSDFPFSPNCRFQPRIYFSPPAGVEGLFCFLPSDTPLPLRDIFGSTLKGNKICCPSPSSLRLLFH